MAQWFLANIASCNQYVPESGFVGFSGCISDIFYIGKWLGVSIGDAWTMVKPALSRDSDSLSNGSYILYKLWRDM